MAKSIPIRSIQNIEGNPIRVPQLDADGDIRWEEACPVCERPEKDTAPQMEDLTTHAAIKMLVFSIPSEMRKTDDSHAAYRVMNALLRAKKKNRDIHMEDADYEWLHRLIARKVPKGKDSAADMEAGNYADGIWGINGWAVQEQLTPDGLPDDIDLGDEVEADTALASLNGKG